MEIKPNMIIRCKTYEEAFELCKKVIKDKPMYYISYWVDYWKVYKSATCYQVNNNCDGFYFYGDTDAFKDKEIILYSDLIKETTDNKVKNLSNPKEVITTMENIQEHYNDLSVFVRNKTIDEFVEQLKEKILEEIDDVSERQRNYEVGSEMSITCSHIMGTLRDVHHRVIDEIAEKMKGNK